MIGCKARSAPVTHAATVDPPPKYRAGGRQIRASGVVQPVRYFTVTAPQIIGQPGRLTLTKLVANGAKVRKDEILAEFDRTEQQDNALEAQAKFEDLSHQVAQREAQNRSDATRRMAELKRAEADLSKAQLQISKSPLLSEIDRLKAAARLEDAKEHVASLNKSNRFRDAADTASLRILELQRDRQKVSLDRATVNAAKLQIKAPLDGMVALENVYRNGSMGPPQEGDQLWPGYPLLRIFDPSEMEVRVDIGEPDGAVLLPGCRAEVRLDAYPDLAFPAHFRSANPAAASALGSPLKTFSARFLLDKSDPHLLPDLSAAVIISPGADR
ncbi:MAG: efflux RND transporter periplasmic adaptor subunit [Acidobacteria bacterium]|nr:efflux RND transporter periplasmic adaptor subunit [Acidobacteriota bacterium]